MRKNGIAIIAVLLLLAWGIYDFAKGDEEALSTDSGLDMTETIEIGVSKEKKAPDFRLTNLEGEMVSLSDYDGKKVILNFWATWCPPCRAEMPHMQKFYEDYKDEAVVLAVNMTHTEKSSGDIESFAAKYKLSFPIVLDEAGSITDKYRVFAYPTSFILDGNGVIREIYQGAISYDIMVKAISSIR